MNILNSRKNKISLTDYNYKRDIETRLLMSALSKEAIRTLNEILDGSLKTTVSLLSETLDITEDQLTPILEQLSKTKLFKRQGDLLIIDKEMRKYLEFEVLKFDPDYEMGMDYLQGLLAKVPINAIPNWYPLSRTSDHLFLSIIEKYLLTPQIYQRYLDDLIIDYPFASKIAHEIMKCSDSFLKAADLMKKYHMSHEAFHECMLHLEYNLVCCLTYRLVDDHYEEIVVPFFEWQEHLAFLKETLPSSIPTPEAIVHAYDNDFGFLKRLAAHVGCGESGQGEMTVAMKMLHLGEETPNGWKPSDRSSDWLQLPIQEQAAALYRCKLHSPYSERFGEKDLRQIQKSLKRVTKSGWLYIDDFLAGFTHAIGGAEEISLKNRGKRWRYARPTLAPAEKKFIHYALFEVFLQVGIVATGTHEGKECFCVTPFGRMSIED